MASLISDVWAGLRDAGLPVGILPIEVSLVVQPEEAAALAAPRAGFPVYEWKLAALRQVARPYVAWKRRPKSGAVTPWGRSPEELRSS